MAHALDDVSLALRAGEIVGIAGVSGNGQEALADVLCGLARAGAGTVSLAGARCRADPRAWIAAGVARIPEDRHAVGVDRRLAVWENAIAERYRKPFASAGLAAPQRPRASYARALTDASTCAAAGSTRRRARCRAATCRS